MTRREDDMHQPPNPADVQRVPPGSPDCARVRGLLRDYSDGDLSDKDAAMVDEHVHGCRVCAVELARAEHEVLRLRRVFLPQQVASDAPAGFARRVVDRLVLESGGSDISSGGASGGGSSGGDDSSQRDKGGSRRNGVIGSPAGMLVAGLMLLFTFAVFARVVDGEELEPQRIAKLVVLDADQAFDGENRTLGAGSSVFDQQSIWLKRGGQASIYWHDEQKRSQPAATIKMQGGELKMEDGSPLLVDGKVVVETNRDVTVPIADGTDVLLGVGEYVITAEIPLDMIDWEPEDGLLPGQLSLDVSVEVRSGEPAQILRGGSSLAVVSQGNVGTAVAGGPVAVGPIGPAPIIEREDQAAPEAPADLLAWVRGHALGANGLPSVGAEVYLSYASQEAVMHGARVTGSDGAFALQSDTECESAFAIVLAVPEPTKKMLGVMAPHAVPLIKQGIEASLHQPLRFATAKPITGTVRNASEQALMGAQVVPCIVDDLFGTLLALTGQRAVTSETGAFRIERAPAELPKHQSLVLLLLHGDQAPTVVPIPSRGAAEAVEDIGTVTMGGMRWVRLRGLPPNTSLTVYEEVPGLPSGAAAISYVVDSNVFGDVLTARVGPGRMWVRRGQPGAPMLSEMKLQEIPYSGIPRYMMEVEMIDYDDLFRPLQAIAGSPVSVANSYRYQEFEVSRDANTASGRALLVVDTLGYVVAGAEVFAVDRTGPRSEPNVRFLGFTSPTGAASIATVRANEDVVVTGPNGALGFVARPTELGYTVTATLHATGRVNLAPALRLPAESSDHWVALHFTRHQDLVFPGVEQNVVRYANENNAWEVSGLVPGTYTVRVRNCGGDDGVLTTGVTVDEVAGASEPGGAEELDTYTIVVPPSGFAVLGS